MIWPFRRRDSNTPSPPLCSRPAQLRIESLEDRSVPAVVVSATGTNFFPNPFGGGPFFPFDNFTGTVRSASGDVNGDGVADIITAQGVGSGSASRIRIFDGASSRFQSRAVVIADFYAYSNVPDASQTPGFAGGVFVASADLNGDGFAEVITSPGVGASGHLKVFNFNNGAGGFLGSAPSLRASFFAYPGFLGEIRVATLDPGSSQLPLLVTASGAGTTQSDIRLYTNAFNIGSVASDTLVVPVVQMFPYPGYLGGVSIAGGNAGRLFVSPNVGQAQVTEFDLNAPVGGPMTLSPGVTLSTGFNSPSDARLGVADVNGDSVPDVLTSSIGKNATGAISVFSLSTDTLSPLTGLVGFQGFGFFGDSWVG
ncbi:FG-GAP repeat domain-containing protein [Gemmata massiliana]|nr:VCBS repeat-containing protein [Gemmata massiliana]